MPGHWLSDVFSQPGLIGIFVVAAKTTVVYFFLVLGLRLLGKRELGQMTIFDLVLVIVLANSVQNAMVGNDNTLAGGLVAATTLLVLSRLLTLLLNKNRKLTRALVGEPLLIVSHGHLLPVHMQKEGITKEQVMAALREHGLSKLDQARIAVLEVDGTISVVPEESKVFRTQRHYRALRLP
jgi:uncharacterized membrane protein YcaP (DUF421 family)